MPSAVTYSRILRGLESFPVQIEVNAPIAPVDSFLITGFPDRSAATARELRIRVLSALEASGVDVSRRAIEIKIDPPLEHSEPSLDLPVAVAVAIAVLGLRPRVLQDYLIVGELSLAGEVRRIRGVLPLLSSPGYPCCEWIVPADNGPEAAKATDLARIACNLRDVIESLKTHDRKPENWKLLPVADSLSVTPQRTNLNYQPLAANLRGAPRRALSAALDALATQEQHLAQNSAQGPTPAVLLLGPPGGGKTLIARAIHEQLSLMPMPGSVDHALSCMLSVAGLLEPDGLTRGRPFRAPHHTVSEAGLVGGGARPRPGEVSIAHGGVLFLDELQEFRISAIEALSRPLAEGRATVARSSSIVSFPARPVALVAAAYPCPCGYFGGHPSRTCRCPESSVKRYQKRLDQMCALLHIKARITVEPVSLAELTTK